MPTVVEKLPEEPIIVVHAIPGEDDIIREMAEGAALITRTLDEQSEHVFLVMDMRDITMALDDILKGAAISGRGQGAMLHHPRIRETVYVLTDGMLRMAVKGLDSATFGLIKARLFDTAEEALAYCRGNIDPGFQQ